MSKIHFRSRRRETPGYPTREVFHLDRRPLLAAGLGALLAAGPLAGCDSPTIRNAAAETAPPAARKTGGAPMPATDGGRMEPPVLRTGGKPATASDLEAPEAMGGAPPPPRVPGDAPDAGPASAPEGGKTQP
jgi:hypothetical protein